MAALPPSHAVTARMVAARAEETVAALDVVARFEHAVDTRDRQAFVAMFTDDGQITGSMQAGPADLVNFLDHDRDGPPLAHLTANHVVSSAGAGALRVQYMLVVLGLDTEAPRIVRINRITDDLVATPDGWRIRRHDVARFSSGSAVSA